MKELKNIKIGLISQLLLAIVLISCVNKNGDNTIIRGTVTGKIDSVTLSVQGENISAPVDAKGSFQIEYKHEKPEYSTLKGTDEMLLYVTPGSELVLDFSIDTIRISGDNKEINNYLQSRDEDHNTVLSGFRDGEIFALPEQKFVRIIDSFSIELDKPLQILMESKSVSHDFIDIEKERLKYWKFDMLMTYHRYSPTFTQKIILPQKDYFDFLISADFNNTDLFAFDEYKEFLYSYILGMSYIKSVEDSLTEEATTKMMLSMTENQYKVQEIKDFVVLKVMNRLLSKLQLNDEIIKEYKQKYADLKGFDKILSGYEKTKYLLKGNKAPDFTVYNQHGQEVQLSDFVGKPVYIDLWSPFCAPCIHEFKFCHKLQEEFKNRELVFLSVCLDEDEARWKKNIERYHLKGEVLRAKDGRRSELCAQYSIQGVPRFILIDKEGKIVTASAPYPSDASLKDLLNKYVL